MLIDNKQSQFIDYNNKQLIINIFQCWHSIVTHIKQTKN